MAAVKRAALAFLADAALTLAAALAFYTVLSFVPLVLLSVRATSSFGGDTQATILLPIAALAGNDAKRAAPAIIANSARLMLDSFTGIAAAVVVAISATAIPARLQLS
jgi:membrane protein